MSRFRRTTCGVGRDNLLFYFGEGSGGKKEYRRTSARHSDGMKIFLLPHDSAKTGASK